MRRRNPANAEQHHRDALLRPPSKSFKQNVKDMIWDSEKKTCFTRSPLNWFTISVYYVLFVAIVFVLFYFSVHVVNYVTHNNNRPPLILGDSPIGTAPSLNYFPLRDAKPLLWISSGSNYTHYIQAIEEQFKEYKEANSSFSTEDFNECSKAPFGYDKQTPCIFFRLNRLILWKPTPYTSNDSLPDDVPEDIKQLIKSSPDPKIWLSCNGTTAKDRDHIGQDFFQLQGSKGFDVSVFPFDGQKSFVDPMVALKINDSQPQATLYSFTCVAWSKNLDVKKTAVDVLYLIE